MNNKLIGRPKINWTINRIRQALLLKSVPIPETGCRIWQGSKMNKGYGVLCIHNRHKTAHRLSYEAFKGPIPQGLMIRHSCHNRLCIEPEHLSVGTAYDNEHDKIRAGRNRKAVGEKCATAKLTENQVVWIRRMLMSGLSLRKIAAICGVKHPAILKIKHNQSWKHVKHA